MGFDDILFTNFNSVNVKLVFDSYLDNLYKVEGPLGEWDYSSILKDIDPAEYDIMKRDFIIDNYVEYRGECWMPEDFEEAKEIAENDDEEEDED